jgi:predicted Zn-ribbon and HTH transcriptional regulator
MDEKDHLGEKMRLKERAEEDRYFAERDRELIAKLKQAQEAEQEKTIRELAHARCPHCGERLRQRPLHEVMVEECPSCQGVWLDKTKLTDVSRSRGKEWTANFLEGLARLMEHPHG